MPEKTTRSLAHITVTRTERPADVLADSGMESLRQEIPALRCLPLLQKLARGESGEVCLDYLSSMQLLVEIR